MRKIFVLILLAFAFGLNISAGVKTILKKEADTTAILNKYLGMLQKLVGERDSFALDPQTSPPDAYFFQVLSAPTLYSAPLHQMMSSTDSLTEDNQVQRIYNINRSLSQLYVSHPELVWQTDTQVKEQGKFRDDVAQKVEAQDKLTDKVTEATLTPEFDDKVEVVTRRPNFWKISGNTAFQFAQNYFSENWYQGGVESYSGTATINLRANYNNQRNLTWDNLLELQLGFQTNKENKPHAFKPTSNMLRFTTNFGLKAYKNMLYYSAQVRISTQLVPNYNTAGDVISDIFSPADITVAPGMKYTFQWGKKKRFSGTLNVAPLAWNIRYVGRDELVKSHGVDVGHHSKHSFGPNVTLDTTWKICNQISWVSRVYWFSNLHYTRVDWTNTFNFQVNKLISAQLNVYPRYDDSNKVYRQKSKHDIYLMFKEWLSMGINYSF